jgi:hypothetical protein
MKMFEMTLGIFIGTALSAAIFLILIGVHKHTSGMGAVPEIVYQQPSTVYEIIYNGCEYVSFGGAFSHKGNCTNSIHQHDTN